MHLTAEIPILENPLPVTSSKHDRMATPDRRNPYKFGAGLKLAVATGQANSTIIVMNIVVVKPAHSTLHCYLCMCFHNNTQPEGHAFPHKSRDMRNIVYPHFATFDNNDSKAT